MFIKTVIECLNTHKVAYALVGGYAVALHGAVRGTIDVDIVIQLSKTAFRKAENALLSIGLKPRLPVSADEVFDFREEYINNKNLIAWSFINPDRPSEIVDIIITDNLKDIKTVTKSALGLKVKVASIPDLIRLKKAAGREQDLLDIKALEKLL